MPKISSYGGMTPILTDLLYGVDDPGGAPDSNSMTIQALLTLFEANFAAASLTVQGKVELATVAEMDIGTDTGRALSVNEFVASDFGTKEIGMELFASGDAVAIGNGTSGIPIPASMDGYDIVDVVCTVHDQGVTNSTDVMVRRRRAGSDVDVLSTPVTIGAEQFASDGVVNGSNDDVNEGDIIYFDVDAIHSGTAPNGLSVAVLLRKP